MLVYKENELKEYKESSLAMQSSWNERDFVKSVATYFQGKTEKVLAVSGLRGTGKTVGILQATKNLDVVYLLAQKNEEQTGQDYVNFLKNTDKKYVIIDEYSWIKERKDLDYYLLTAVQNGKRVVITATESITLDFLNYGALNHRVQIVHTTMFTYEEYLRLYHKKHSKEVCKEFLLEGGLFQDYILKNFDQMKAYVEEAIVDNLAGYLKDEISPEIARTLTYAVLYKAICPSNLSKIPTLRKDHVTLGNFLEQMGINSVYLPEEKLVHRVADIFEQVGIIVRIPNFNKNSKIREQYYITNPSLTCQLIKQTYQLNDLENTILGHVFESVVAVQLFNNMLSEHCIYFYNNGTEQNNPDNKELDIVITDKEKEYAYFFECKFKQDETLKSDITLLSGYLEDHEFDGMEIEGRYVVYNGKPVVKENYAVGTILFTPIGDILNNYFEFAHNVSTVKSRNPDLSSAVLLGNAATVKEEDKEEKKTDKE